MKGLKIDYAFTLIYSIFLFFFLLAGLEIGTELNSIIILLLTSFEVIILLMILRKKKVNKLSFSFGIPYLIFNVIYLINFSSNLQLIVFQIIFGLICIIALNISWEKKNIIIFSRVCLIFYPIILYFVFSENTVLNTNKLGAYAFMLSFFPILYIVNYTKKFKVVKLILIIVLTLFIILFTGTRSILLSIFFMILTLILWKTLSKNKTIYNLFFVFIIVFCILFTIVYPQLDTLIPNFHYYNNIIIEYTGKSLFSGRNELWKIIINLVKAKPFLGYGSGTLISDFLFTNLSAHNLYLQIGLQVGLIGISALIVCLFNIWKAFWNNRYNKKVIIVACYFVGFIIYQLSEISLTQNNFTFSVLHWLIIGIGLSFCEENKAIRS